MSFLDSIGETLQDAVGLYGQIEAVKLKTQLAKAEASVASAAAATPLVQTQASPQTGSVYQGENKTLIYVGLGVVSALALYAIVK